MFQSSFFYHFQVESAPEEHVAETNQDHTEDSNHPGPSQKIKKAKKSKAEVDQAAKAEDLGKKKKAAAKKGAANIKGKSDDIGEDDVETNKDEDVKVAPKENTQAAEAEGSLLKNGPNCQVR